MTSRAPGEPLSRSDPREIGRYSVDRRLGAGGMGVVYLGRDATGHPVAIKVIRPELARHAHFRERFRREVANARRVARFCTAAVLDAEPDGDPAYLVTDYVAGPTLGDVVERKGPLSPAALEHLALNVATALTAIHGAGVIHRDLKPQNVLLSVTGARVIDFGIARALDSTTAVSQDLSRIGTPAYMAPEQVAGAEPTPALDIFAWGGIVIFAGTAGLPFGDGPISLLPYRIVHEDPVLDGLDPRLGAVVAHAMRKDPSERPTATELYDMLLGPLGVPPPAPRLAAPFPPVKVGEWRLASLSISAGQPAAGIGFAGPDPSAPEGKPHPGDPADQGDQADQASPGDARDARSAAGEGPGEGADASRPTRADRSGRAKALARLPVAARRFLARRRRWMTVVAMAAVMALGALTAVVLGDADPVAPRVVVDKGVAARRLLDKAMHVRNGDPALARRLTIAAHSLEPSAPAANMVVALAEPAVLGGSVTADIGRSGDRVVLATVRGQQVVVWDVTNIAEHQLLSVFEAGDVAHVAMSADGRWLVTAGRERGLWLWDLQRPEAPGPPRRLADESIAILHVAFSSNSWLLAATDHAGIVRVWDVDDSTSAEPDVVLARPEPVVATRMDPDSIGSGQWALITIGVGGTLEVWDLADLAQPVLAGSAHVDGYTWDSAVEIDARAAVIVDRDGASHLAEFRVAVSSESPSRGPAELAARHVVGSGNRVRDAAFVRETVLVRDAPEPAVENLDGSLAVLTEDGFVELWHNKRVDPGIPPNDFRGFLPPLGGQQPGFDVRPSFAGGVAQAFTIVARMGLLAAVDATDSPTGITVWDLDVERVKSRLCASFENRITVEEWARYAPGLPYSSPCPQ